MQYCYVYSPSYLFLPRRSTWRPECSGLFCLFVSVSRQEALLQAELPSHRCLQSRLCTTWIFGWAALLSSQNLPRRRRRSPGRPRLPCAAGRRCPDTRRENRKLFISNSLLKNSHSSFVDWPSAYLRGVSFNGRAALRATVQGKVNERLGVRESHLVDMVVHDIECNRRRLTGECWPDGGRCPPEAAGQFWRKVWGAAQCLSCFPSARRSQCPAEWKPLLQSGSSRSWRTESREMKKQKIWIVVSCGDYIKN